MASMLYDYKKRYVEALSDFNSKWDIYEDIVTMEYECSTDVRGPFNIPIWERIKVTLVNGYTFNVTVNGDNCAAMKRDIERALAYYEENGEYEQ